MGISRQAYYKGLACERTRREQHAAVVELVSRTRQRQPRIGTRKLHGMLEQPLQDAGIKIGRDALFKVLRTAHMLVAPRRASPDHPKQPPFQAPSQPAQSGPGRPCGANWM